MRTRIPTQVSRTLFSGLLVAIACSLALSQNQETSTGFAPLDEWRSAVLAGDQQALGQFYRPNAEVDVRGGTMHAADDVSFWTDLKARSMKIEIVRLKQRPGAASVIFKAELKTANGTLNVTDAQAWRQEGGRWRITGAERTDDPHLPQPSDMKKDLYPADADARAEIKEAEQKAQVDHKRVLLVFGANWCYDCHVLDAAFHRPDFASVMKGYEVVHVDIGDDGKKNNDVAREFETPLDKGVPVLAVLDSDGTVVVSQKNGEFEDARALTPQALLEFLTKWRPQQR